MIPKSGYRFSDKIMLQQICWSGMTIEASLSRSRKVQHATCQDVALDFRRAAVDGRTPRLQERGRDVHRAIVRLDQALGGRVAARGLEQQAAEPLQELGPE